MTSSSGQGSGATVGVAWNHVLRQSKTALSMEVCVEPPMRRRSRIHDQLYEAIRYLQANYVRFAPWRAYPKLAVAELKPPRDGRTFWDFSYLDPLLVDFMKATSGHPVVIDISTIPQWMFKTDKPVPYPANPDEITWNYEHGTKLRDPSMKEVADYWARVASWYTRGGFKDEYGQWHQSGYHFKFDYWEVLNEVDQEHQMSPQFYTALYDATVAAVHKVSPQTKFVGLALTPGGAMNPEYFEYFLNHKNHKPGIPLDAISFHFYAVPAPDETPAVMQHTFFDQANGFINVVRYIEAIRRRLSPETKTFVDEVGTILPDPQAPHLARPIPDSYWNLSGAMFAYIYARLAGLGIDVVNEAELIDYPGQYAGTTLVDWKTGRPNARYWVLKLLRENFGPGDKLVETQVSLPAYVYAQGFVTPDGKRKILLVNKRDQSFDLVLPEGKGARVEYVDQTTGFEPPATTTLENDQLRDC